MPRNPLAFAPAHPDARPAATVTGGLYGDALTSYIRRRAQQLGLDPLVPLAVAPHEGGFAGAVGDQGSSFGPFQLHVGGALPAAHVADARTWANSPAGVDYALGALAKTLGGRRGQAGVAAAVREFERPAAQYVPGEIGKATATYQQLATSAAPPSPAPPPVRTPRAADWTSALRGGTRPQTGGNWVDALSGTTTAAPTAATSKPASWVEALAGKTPPPPASEPGPLPLAQPRNVTEPPVVGRVTVAPAADRPGVSLRPQVVRFVGQIAGVYGQPLTIGTGTNHNEYVAGTRRESAHWTGWAADVPASGSALTRLGQSALVAAGMSPAQARQAKGGLFNVNGYQIIFNSNIGGNHWNHLHVGLAPARQT